MKTIKRYPIKPVPKPRMTQRDKWAKRPVVVRYFAFKDQVRALKVELPKRKSHVVFIIEMPRTWTKRKKLKMVGSPHEQKPDLDNMIKALGDAVYDDDSAISDIRASKFWGIKGEIIIYSEIVNKYFIQGSFSEKFKAR